MSEDGEWRWPAGSPPLPEGSDRGWNGKRGDGCGENTLWEESFLFLVYHVAQSLRFARKVTAGRGKSSLFPTDPPEEDESWE